MFVDASDLPRIMNKRFLVLIYSNISIVTKDTTMADF